MTPNAVIPASSSTAAPTSSARERRGRAPARPEVASPVRPPLAQVERGVVGEDPLVQPAQLGAGLDADLLDERRARLPVRLQRLRLPPGAVEREHPLAVQALAQRVLGDQPVELADQLGVAPGRQVGVDRHLGGAQAQLLEAPDLDSRRTARRPGPPAARPATAPAPRAAATPPAAAPPVPRRHRPQRAAARSRDRASRFEPPRRRARGADATRRAAPSSPRSAAARSPHSPSAAGRPTPSCPAPARASRAPPAACAGPARSARPRGEPRAALAAARPP